MCQYNAAPLNGGDQLFRFITIMHDIVFRTRDVFMHFVVYFDDILVLNIREVGNVGVVAPQEQFHINIAFINCVGEDKA